MFPNNEIIISAIKSKRFIEIDQGYFQKNYNLLDSGNVRRNTVIPMMVTQISHITISEKYGGTTSLESIVLNKKNVLINDKNFKWDLDKQLKNNIEFKNIDSILKKLKTYNPKKKKQAKFGDWYKIIKNNKILNYQIKKDKFLTEFNKFIKKMSKVIIIGKVIYHKH